MSRIFLSFSDLEGLGLPPIEAALCGNYVIGYHGGGGREYWRAPTLSRLTQATSNRLRGASSPNWTSWKNGPPTPSETCFPGIHAVRARYSPANEQAALRRFVSAIGATIAGTQPGSTRRLDSLSKLQRRAKLRWWLGATVAG